MSSHTPAIYNQSGLYDQQLPPYIFETPAGVLPDEEVLQTWLFDKYGKPDHQLDILEIGAGTGRMTEQLAPYAGRIVCSDKYPAMLTSLQSKIPDAEVVAVNTRDLKKVIQPTKQFDLVGAFWTLSYPVGEYLETIERDTIIPRPDFDTGVSEATAMVSGLTDYIKEDGTLVAYFFDSESPEQQAVTKIWQQLAPDPGGYRGFTREVAAKGLQIGASNRGMDLTNRILKGIAPFENDTAMTEWYAHCHCKGLGSLVMSEVFTEQTDQLIDEFQNEDGTISLPVGMHEFVVTRNKA